MKKDIKEYVCGTVLTIIDQQLTLGDIQVVTRFLQEHSNITHLNLHWNNTDHEGVKALAESKNLSNLTYLGLEHNNIDIEGMLDLVKSKITHPMDLGYE